MRFSENKEKTNLEKFTAKLISLNPKVTFDSKVSNPYHLLSNLDKKDLPFLSLPKGATFSKRPDFTSEAYGFVMINYKKKDYTIFGKGYENY